MATAVAKKSYAPYAVQAGQTALDSVTATYPPVTVVVTFTLTGTVAQVAADWATLAAATITAPSSTIDWGV